MMTEQAPQRAVAIYVQMSEDNNGTIRLEFENGGTIEIPRGADVYEQFKAILDAQWLLAEEARGTG